MQHFGQRVQAAAGLHDGLDLVQARHLFGGPRPRGAELFADLTQLLLAHELGAGSHQVVGGPVVLRHGFGVAHGRLQGAEPRRDVGPGAPGHAGPVLLLDRQVGVGDALGEAGQRKHEAAVDPVHAQPLPQGAQGHEPRLDRRRLAGAEPAGHGGQHPAQGRSAGELGFAVELERVHDAPQRVVGGQDQHLAVDQEQARVAGLAGRVELVLDDLQALRVDQDRGRGGVAGRREQQNRQRARHRQHQRQHGQHGPVTEGEDDLGQGQEPRQLAVGDTGRVSRDGGGDRVGPRAVQVGTVDGG